MFRVIVKTGNTSTGCLPAAGMHSVVQRTQTGDPPRFVDVILNEVVRPCRPGTLDQNGAHRPGVQLDHLAVLTAKLTQRRIVVPAADRHEEGTGNDVGEVAGVLEELGDLVRDGQDATALAKGVAHRLEELGGGGRVHVEVASVEHDGTAGPLVRHEETTRAQETRYLREKPPVVTDLRSTDVSVKVHNVLSKRKDVRPC